ncbi:hypothetical protein JAAARDRAFT_51467 [Jaapia argillacea MUCL 33604]|uniref:BAH domain-containing protein n=1 Tax=Jaapia argillacea MUCL 33604 TaxID=933084 RepID=A0A067P597_9AGAM|nr:hypothetical protein JAAARDRAFT_51467 [Jaapia argillacea MUCL 33604]
MSILALSLTVADRVSAIKPQTYDAWKSKKSCRAGSPDSEGNLYYVGDRVSFFNVMYRVDSWYGEIKKIRVDPDTGDLVLKVQWLLRGKHLVAELGSARKLGRRELVVADFTDFVLAGAIMGRIPFRLSATQPARGFYAKRQLHSGAKSLIPIEGLTGPTKKRK